MYHITLNGAAGSFLICFDNLTISGTYQKYINFEIRKEIISCIRFNLIDNITVYNDDKGYFDIVFENGQFVVPFPEVL